MSQMRGTSLNGKVTIELTQGELAHLMTLVGRNIRKTEREYHKPHVQAKRKQYFTDHPEKSDLAEHLLDRERRLLERLREAFGEAPSTTAWRKHNA